MNTLEDGLGELAKAIVVGKLPVGRNLNSPNYSSELAIEIYRNNYLGNLHDALAGAYPVMEQLVGKAFFRRLTHAYIEQQPSTSGNLHHYGSRLDAFVSTFEPAQQLAYLPDVATLEWACHTAYFADDSTTFDIDLLMQVSPEHYANIKFTLHPACRVIHTRYPVAVIWQAHQPGAPEDFQIDLQTGSRQALVSRAADSVHVTELSEADAAWLAGIGAGITLGEATENTLAKHAEFDLRAVLALAVSQGAFSGMNIGELA